MAKQTIQSNMSEIRTRVEEALERGEDREAIVENLHKEYYDRNTLSLFVAGVPDSRTKHRFLRHNSLLLILLLLVAVVQVATVMTSVVFHGLLPLAPLVRMPFALFFRARVREFGAVYWPLALLALCNLQVLSNPPAGTVALAFMEAVLSIAIAVLSYIIVRNVFPQLGPLGVRKGHNK